MKKLFFLFAMGIQSAIAMAQEDPEAKETAKMGGAWYSSPWVWVVVAAIFVLLLVIFTPGKKNKRL